MLLPAAVVTATDISTWLDVLLHVQNTSPFCVWMLTTFNGPFVFSCLFWYLGVRYMDLPVVLSVTYHLVLILYTIVTMKNTPRTAPIQENIIVFWVEERSVEGGGCDRKRSRAANGVAGGRPHHGAPPGHPVLPGGHRVVHVAARAQPTRGSTGPPDPATRGGRRDAVAQRCHDSF